MEKKKNRIILPYVAYGIRVLFALFAMTIAVVRWKLDMKPLRDQKNKKKKNPLEF